MLKISLIFSVNGGDFWILLDSSSQNSPGRILRHAAQKQVYRPVFFTSICALCFQESKWMASYLHKTSQDGIKAQNHVYSLL